MAITEGSKIYFAYKKESTPNVEETGSGGTILRRVTGTLDLAKPEVTSAEKRDDFQEVTVNHGTRSVNWQIQSELFGGDYTDFLGSLLRRDFATVSTVSAGASDGFTISSGVLTRAAGGGESFLTDGIRAGMVVRFTNLTTAGNNNRNIRITAVTATTLTLVAVDGGAAVADSTSSTTATMVIVGQVSYIPSTGHTSDTYTMERHDRALDVSEVGYGVKIGSFDVSVQPDQPVDITFAGLGIDRTYYSAGNAPSLTSPTAAGVGPALSSAVGVMRVNGVAQAIITGFSLNIDLGVQNRAVAFNNLSPDVFYGRSAQITGTINAMRSSNALATLFDDETEVVLELFLESPGAAPKSFFNIYLARVKLNSADMDDPDGPAIQTFSFRALKPTSGATGVEQTAILIQDSSAS